MGDSSPLAALPTEVLWRIATWCPADSALALSQTCRRLHGDIYDAILFKNIIKAQALNGTGLGIEVDALASMLGSDVQTWVRLAFADSKARSLRWRSLTEGFGSDISDDDQQFLQSLDSFAPSLVAMKHRSILNRDATEILIRPFVTAFCRTSRRLRSISQTTYENAAALATPGLAFFLCATALSFIKTFPGYDRGTLASMLIRNCIAAAQHSEFGSESFERTFTIRFTLLSLCSWASLLNSHIEMLGDFSEPRIPTPDKIPWPSFGPQVKIPLPFFESLPDDFESPESSIESCISWDQWYADCVASMTERSFLADGEWCGYWSFESFADGAAAVSFAECIDRMAIVVPRMRDEDGSDEGKSDGGPIPIMSKYLDSFHDFMLYGYIYRNGFFQLGPPGDSWVWRGRMTPFGMFGFWGSSDWTSIAGACWLWKRTWCTPTRLVRTT